MCNYTYLKNKRTTLLSQCPYPALFHKWKNNKNKTFVTLCPIDLPHDKNGKCLFHSNDFGWKKESNFHARFNDLVLLVNNDRTLKEIDFRGFIFINTDSKNSRSKYKQKFYNIKFERYVRFDSAKFKGMTFLNEIVFERGGNFSDAEFFEKSSFINCNFNGFSLFDRAVFNDEVYFNNTNFNSGVTFTDVRFLNGVDFHKLAFKHMTSFDEVYFSVKNIFTTVVHFKEVIFDFGADFSKSVFECAVIFEQTAFHNRVDFVDTQFNLRQTVDPLRCSVDFCDFKLSENGTLNFTSNDTSKKLFNHDVGIRYKEGDLEGLILFENANFHNISDESKKLLTVSEKSGKVQIGKGCIKYRFQSKKRTFHIGKHKQNFILEITQVYANYFTNYNGLNLGVEITERTPEKITYFFFSDENITEKEFILRMQESEHNLWDLLFMDKEAFAKLNQQLLGSSEKSPISTQTVNIIDSISSLVSILFRLKNRTDLGLWTEEDTASLVKAVNIDQPTNINIESLHFNLSENYHQSTLIDLSSTSNQNIKRQVNMGKESVYIEKIKSNESKKK